jgi:hypothetical protein
MNPDPSFHPASTTSVVLFSLILSAILLMLFFGVARASRLTPALLNHRLFFTALFTVIWLGAFTAIIKSGVVAAQPMPRLMILFAAVNIVSITLALSPIGGWLATGLTPGLLVFFHSFRLPLEVILHQWAKAGTIPVTMTWSGSNFDIITGILALLLAPFATRFRGLAWTFNIVGLLLLINVIRVAILSSPLPFAWPVDPPLLLALHLPYALIAPVCVGGALAAHLILFRALLHKPRGPSLEFSASLS